MVFFNYSTMQMAAKVVYYGPGLCGKTTNLQWIFEHTSNDSRGEMVSLATETDRTLFFDLLPIDVGSIAGFSTRIQLYTVPGQVFYNTTRKLVLKGVDGVVFVADSQKPMLQANIESFQNLEENLAEMGLGLDTIPLVLQFNKRDLPNIMSPEEMNEALNPDGNYQWLEASALNGDGVFETLKTISKATLLALKKRLTKGRSDQASGGKRGTSASAKAPAKAPPRPAAPAPAPAPRPAAPAPPPKPSAPTAPAPAATESQVSPGMLPETEEVTGPVKTRHDAKPLAPAPPSPLSLDPPEIDLEPVPVPELEPVFIDPPSLDAEPVAARGSTPMEGTGTQAQVTPASQAGPAEAPLNPASQSQDAEARSSEAVQAATSAPQPETSRPATEAPDAVAKAPQAVAGQATSQDTASSQSLQQPAAAEPRNVPKPAAKKKTKSKSIGLDALAELEKLRKQTLRLKSPVGAAGDSAAEVKKSLHLPISETDLRNARGLELTVQLNDSSQQPLGSARTLRVDLDDVSDLKQLLVHLKIALGPET